MKTCRRCKIEQPLENFNKEKRVKNGLLANCKSCHNAYVRSNYKKQPKEKIRLIAKKKYYKYYDKIRAKALRYTRNNRDKIRISNNKRYHISTIMDSKYTHLSDLITRKIFNNQCFNCGSTSRLVIDHHYPLSKKFGLSLYNAVLLCQFCNGSKHNKLPIDFYPKEKFDKLEYILSILEYDDIGPF